MCPAASCSAVASWSDTRCFLSTSPHPLIKPFIQEPSLYGRYELFLQLGWIPSAQDTLSVAPSCRMGNAAPSPRADTGPAAFSSTDTGAVPAGFHCALIIPTVRMSNSPAPSAQRHKRRRQQAPGNSGVSQYPAQQGRPGTALDVSVV